jgi:sphinganine-1-phosphate aldolase
MRYLGVEGYTRIAGRILETSRRLQAGLQAIDGVELVCRPDLPILAWSAPRLPIGRVATAMTERGWFIRQMVRPAAIHMGMITMQQEPVVDNYLGSVSESIAELRQT